ncbi:MAG: orotate phosphoribosyltransferase [Candidatus Tokpelaia sp. JSC161]|nr:MAG: orotate phosphoribosyltransferase [Candidatus Tokpelaia sp. JSC161]
MEWEMENEDVLKIFRKAGAILNGHFILRSGRHSAIYMQKAHVFMHADFTERLCCAIAAQIRLEIGDIDYIAGLAIGGLIPAYETSRHLSVPVIWVERDEFGLFKLRRFQIKSGARIVILEDVMTTGSSVQAALDAIVHAGGKVIAVACIIDRSGGKIDFGVPLIALAQYEVASYEADSLPEELSLLPAMKL